MLSAPELFMVFVKRQVIFIALNIELLNFTWYLGWQWWVVKNQAVQCVATAAERWVIVCVLVEVVGQDRRIFRNWFQVTLIEVTSEKEVRLMVEVQSSRWRWNIGITQVLQLSLLIRQRQTKTDNDKQRQTMTKKDRQRKTKTAKGRHGTLGLLRSLLIDTFYAIKSVLTVWTPRFPVPKWRSSVWRCLATPIAEKRIRPRKISFLPLLSNKISSCQSCSGWIQSVHSERQQVKGRLKSRRTSRGFVGRKQER